MRKAIGMIELVIAIVVIGIVIITIPMFFLQPNKSNELSIEQEAIMRAQSTLNLILTYEWDENTYKNSLFYSAVLDVTSGDSELNRVGTTTKRVGHVDRNIRRKFFSSETNATKLGFDYGETTIADANDLDDFDGITTTFQVPVSTDTLKNTLLDFNVTANVFYVSDEATYADVNLSDFDFNTTPITSLNASTNIKMVQVSVQGLDTNITLRAFSSNVGESQIARRDF